MERSCSAAVIYCVSTAGRDMLYLPCGAQWWINSWTVFSVISSSLRQRPAKHWLCLEQMQCEVWFSAHRFSSVYASLASTSTGVTSDSLILCTKGGHWQRLLSILCVCLDDDEFLCQLHFLCNQVNTFQVKTNTLTSWLLLEKTDDPWKSRVLWLCCWCNAITH